MSFKNGDKARVVHVRTGEDNIWKVGAVIVIMDVSIKEDEGELCDCQVVCKDGSYAYPFFNQLEPIVEDLSTWEKIQEICNWNPTKEVQHEY